MTDDSEAPSDPAAPPPGRAYEILPPGTRLGSFTVGDAPAYGILGTLYNATRDNGAPVSIFVLPRILTDDEGFLRHFRDYKDRQFRMSNDRILSMSESEIIDDRICFVCEPVTGKSIPDILGAAGVYPTFQNPRGVIRVQPSEAAKDFTPEVVRRVTLQSLEAFEYAHSMGMLHLSFTPSNLILQDNGDIKVLGFGLFGCIGKEAVEMLVSAGIPPVSLGPRNVRLNIADILSPEVQLNREPDARADIYALGMSVYWMLTGLKPAASYRPPSGIVPALEQGWDIFLARCLARDPANRYPNAKAALRDLENLSTLSDRSYADEHTRAKPGRVKAIASTSGGRIIIAVTVIATLGAGAAGGFLYSEQREAEIHSPNYRAPAGVLEITTKPGATLTVTDLAGVAKSLGVAGKDGVVSSKLSPGRYTLTVVMPGGKPSTLTGIELKDKIREKRSIIPADAPGVLAFPALPPGTKLVVDGVDIDLSTNRNLAYEAGKPIGIEVTRPHYRKSTFTVKLGSGERHPVEFPPFITEHGTFSLNITFSNRKATPEQLGRLVVRRNDDGLKAHSWAEAQTLPKELPVGNYLVSLEHPDYEPFQTAFDISDDNNTALAANLVAKPATFELVVKPEGVPYVLSINGTTLSSVPETIPAETPISVRITARDHIDFATTITAHPRQAVKVGATLVKIGAPEAGKSFSTPYIGTRFAWVPAGEAKLGSPASEAGHTAVEEPATLVKFTKGFWMSRTEVTQSEYERVLDRNPSLNRGPDFPVDTVSHEDALRYCRALTLREYDAGRLPDGYEYRLPDEVEWEYACRAGDKPSPAPPPGEGPRPVASSADNGFGIADMRGNVREWMLEPYKNHLPGGRRTDYTMRTSELAGTEYFARGGSWRTGANESRPAYRPTKGMPASTVADDLGFRVVLAPVTTP